MHNTQTLNMYNYDIKYNVEFFANVASEEVS